MKQRITKKQLGELSEKAFLKIEKWKTDRGYDPFPYREKGKWRADTLSIGQMIEFLGDDWFEEVADIIGYGGDAHIEGVSNKELCDLLWSACKEVLKK